ncbi:hypothetical protein [Pseudonocardia sp. KRD291]|uniref:hypothetical protein n=1 Tax=Pseudonocardia sp. KRD291 TaxID=2792007 RepID=UPI001C4A3E57|nr:hypothetical protein [Pseudonocardia sp. KRD291]MBW0104944.1 hypothetical protein [Pseudonocardia sp. KRD291]
MWAFFSRRLRMWLLFAVGAPLLAWLLGRLGDVVERRRGPNGFSRTLHTARGWLRRRTRGPLSHRDTQPLAR